MATALWGVIYCILKITKINEREILAKQKREKFSQPNFSPISTSCNESK
jgi:hypothetical protein